MTELQNEIKEKLTTQHELYISIDLTVPVKPSKFREDIDTLIFEHIGYMQSWGVHTKGEYIGIFDDQEERMKRLQQKYKQILDAVGDIAFGRIEGDYADVRHFAREELRNHLEREESV